MANRWNRWHFYRRVAIIAHRIAVFLNAFFLSVLEYFLSFFLYNVDMYCKALLNTYEKGAI